ncbi:Ricin-type beta-trefoil lectin domain-containing protein [Lentzea albidocapillata subsp. violacea]|uniref:Ricin-type beta-trefoil lectin domain-containing protein n=1 Tax=Lentzea albidocapillata subsp. violacea TaxID=128104 RepID=A0A1G8X1T8_9PSEU|nr:RICIN domain-containing protein [Lentzea albidocapillata]SDJ84503.1 Ricin-type beta-trefoil lectin domain-containing protein [Lentzea albidocapillata subsp. violacea]
MLRKTMVAAAAITMTLSGTALAAAQDKTPSPEAGAMAVSGPFNLRVGFSPFRNLEAVRSTVDQAGGAIRQWQFDGTDEQEWLFFSDASIRPVLNTKMCLDANPDDNRNGGKVYVWPCHGGGPQQWRPWNGQGLTLQNAATGRCLDANPDDSRNGGVIYQWECHGGTPQQWTRVRRG